MNATVSRSAHPWASAHRRLLALVAVAVAAAATVLIVLMTTAGSAPSSVQAPAHGHSAPQIPGPADPRGPARADVPTRCLQHMGLQYMALVPC